MWRGDNTIRIDIRRIKMRKLLWFLETEPCAYCGDDRTSIELTIRASGRVITRKWFCTYKHLAAWWEKEFGVRKNECKPKGS